MSDTNQASVKSSALETLESLPEDATWDDVLYRMYVRQKIEAGLADDAAGRLYTTEEVRKYLGLPQ